MIEGFEGVFDGLCAELDDLKAMEDALQLQRESRQIEVTLVRQLLAGIKPSHIERRLRHLQLLDARIMNHLQARKERLKMMALPEAHRIVQNLDASIMQRDQLASSHNICPQCHGVGLVL